MLRVQKLDMSQATQQNFFLNLQYLAKSTCIFIDTINFFPQNDLNKTEAGFISRKKLIHVQNITIILDIVVVAVNIS